MFDIKKYSTNIICLEFPTAPDACDAMMRFQEYYESPEWKDKVFTRGQFLKWYSDTYGAASYNQDWAGFNLPGEVFKPFIAGLFDPLTLAEQRIVDLVKYKSDKFYVIAYGKEGLDPDTVKHELAHALYYTNPEYHKEMLKLASGTSILTEFLTMKGYNTSVHNDETQAFISCDCKWLKDKYGIDVPADLEKKFKDVFTKYYKEIAGND